MSEDIDTTTLEPSGCCDGNELQGDKVLGSRTLREEARPQYPNAKKYSPRMLGKV